MAGIIGYGAYIPKNRLKIDAIAEFLGEDVNEFKRSSGFSEKSVADRDEDILTMSYEASKQAIENSKLEYSDIDSIMFGSDNVENKKGLSSSMIGLLNLNRNIMASDISSSFKAATSALILESGLVDSGLSKNGIVIGVDNLINKGYNQQNYGNSAGSAAFIIGNGNNNLLDILGSSSYNSNIYDEWNHDGKTFSSGRFGTKNGYLDSVVNSGNQLLKKLKLQPKDFKYAIFSQPNLALPMSAGKTLGFDNEQLKDGILFDKIGFAGSASSMIALCNIIEKAKVGDKIFLSSYGNLYVSDSIAFEVKKEIKPNRNFEHLLGQKNYIRYSDYLDLLNN